MDEDTEKHFEDCEKAVEEYKKQLDSVRADLARILHRFPVLRICPDDESSGAAERD
jgi:hypothetical protein